MRIDNPISPQQSVNSHSLGDGLWLPIYHATKFVSGRLIDLGVGSTQLIAGVEGKRIVLIAVSVYTAIGIGGLNPQQDTAYRIDDTLGNVYFEGRDLSYGSGEVGAKLPGTINYNGGLVTVVDGAPINLSVISESNPISFLYNIVYTFDS